jgi:hypothetical protein
MFPGRAPSYGNIRARQWLQWSVPNHNTHNLFEFLLSEQLLMKRNYLMTLATVAVCLLTTPVLADHHNEKSTDPSGTFNWTQDFGAGEAEHWLVLNANGDKLTGSYVSNGEAVEIQDGKIKDGKFSFKIELEVDGASITTSTEGQVKGDKLTAVTEIDDGSETQEVEFEAGRKTRVEDVVGTWNLTIDAEGQTFEPVAKITKDGDKLKVEYLTDEFGDHEAIDVKLEDNKLSYTIAVESPEGGMKLKFDTAPRGNKMHGDLEYEVGDITGSSEVDGEREVPVSLAGTWNVTIEAEGQVFEPVMKVTENGGKLGIEYLTDEFGDHEATDITLDGDKISFTIATDSPDGSLKLVFALKVDGDELDGEVEYEVGDITGSADVEGEREASAPDLVGTWNLTADAEGQTFEPVMKVTKKDGELAIEYLTDEFGDHEASDIKLDGNKLTFKIAVDSPDGAMELNFTTEIEGDEIDGEVEYVVGDVTGTTEIEGKRE